MKYFYTYFYKYFFCWVCTARPCLLERSRPCPTPHSAHLSATSTHHLRLSSHHLYPLPHSPPPFTSTHHLHSPHSLITFTDHLHLPPPLATPTHHLRSSPLATSTHLHSPFQLITSTHLVIHSPPLLATSTDHLYSPSVRFCFQRYQQTCSTFEGDVQPPLRGPAAFEGRKCQKHRKPRVVAVVLWRRGGERAGRGRCFWNFTVCDVTNAEFSILAVFFFFFS